MRSIVVFLLGSAFLLSGCEKKSNDPPFSNGPGPSDEGSDEIPAGGNTTAGSDDSNGGGGTTGSLDGGGGTTDASTDGASSDTGASTDTGGTDGGGPTDPDGGGTDGDGYINELPEGYSGSWKRVSVESGHEVVSELRIEGSCQISEKLTAASHLVLDTDFLCRTKSDGAHVLLHMTVSAVRTQFTNRYYRIEDYRYCRMNIAESAELILSCGEYGTGDAPQNLDQALIYQKL